MIANILVAETPSELIRSNRTMWSLGTLAVPGLSCIFTALAVLKNKTKVCWRACSAAYPHKKRLQTTKITGCNPKLRNSWWRKPGFFAIVRGKSDKEVFEMTDAANIVLLPTAPLAAMLAAGSHALLQPIQLVRGWFK
jgi:hypothetical protein